MNTHRAGFTLVELIIVALLGAVVLGAAVQSLVLQERTYRTTGEVIRGQDGLRVAMGILESELREVSVTGQLPDGPDIVRATRDSIEFRAQRSLAFVCEVSTSGSERRMWTWTHFGELFDSDQPVLVYQGVADSWLLARAHVVQNSTRACEARPGTVAHQRVDLRALDGQELGGQVLADVRGGAPVRGLVRVTYGLQERDGEWSLVRRQGEVVRTMVRGLAGPGEGLVFTYLDAAGNTITANPVPVASIAAIGITGATMPRPGSGASPIERTTTVFLRNN